MADFYRNLNWPVMLLLLWYITGLFFNVWALIINYDLFTSTHRVKFIMLSMVSSFLGPFMALNLVGGRK